MDSNGNFFLLENKNEQRLQVDVVLFLPRTFTISIGIISMSFRRSKRKPATGVNNCRGAALDHVNYYGNLIGETGAIWQGFLFMNFLGNSKKQKKF